MNNKFLSFFPGHTYRYIDSTGAGRAPQTSTVQDDSLNIKGYESYFTVNGFSGSPNAQKDNCTNLNAFFIDIDGRKDLAELETIKSKLNPSFIIETQNGYHVYWLLDEPIFKEELSSEEWDTAVLQWERIEQSIVTNLDADPVVKDITRILRVPDTYYWKKTGDKWKEGLEGVFKIKGLYKETMNTYSMDEVEEVFPSIAPIETTKLSDKPTTTAQERFAKAEKDNFFERVNEEYPIMNRDSFTKLTTAHPDSLPPGTGRNSVLIVTACLMKQAGWTQKQALEQIEKVGWHGMENEPGGKHEIEITIESAYEKGYTYSYKDEIISYSTSPAESQKMQQAFTKAGKDRKDQDKLRFSNYEREILARNPHLKKNESGVFFQYSKGVYIMLTDQDVSDMFLNGLHDDMLDGYRTKRNVSDKVACLLSIIPTLVITDDKGRIANVKNGLLDIYTRELRPHTPEFVSLIQYPVDYDPSAECPTWDMCMKDWTAGEEQEEKTRLLQQYCGYCLSSSMLHDRALFLVGDGGNGKSTFVDTVARVIGPQATSHIDLEGLYGQYGFKGLIGKRLNIIEEVQGGYYQSNKLKKLISGESVTIDVKYKDQFTFTPQAKFVFAVNMLPRVDDTSTATERRTIVVAFLQNYRENPNIKLRSSVGLLAQELSGILNWMLAGAKDLSDSEAFVVTEEQKKMLDEYREENSSVEGFLSQCIVLNEFSSISTPALYEEYKKWNAGDGGRKAKANITFTKEVRAYGAKGNRFTFESRDTSTRESSFVGIELSPQWKRLQANNHLTTYNPGV